MLSFLASALQENKRSTTGGGEERMVTRRVSGCSGLLSLTLVCVPPRSTHAVGLIRNELVAFQVDLHRSHAAVEMLIPLISLPKVSKLPSPNVLMIDGEAAQCSVGLENACSTDYSTAPDLAAPGFGPFLWGLRLAPLGVGQAGGGGPESHVPNSDVQ